MAGNRSRDLSFSILSDASKFDASGPADDLDKLAGSADDAGASLDDLERARERVDLDRLGDDAKDTARKVDSAFDTIARASKTSTRKIDDDSDKVRGSFNDIRDEANDTGREMAASFSGSADDVLSAFQELGANAGTAFGPIGIAAGIAAGAGVGLIRAEAEKLKELAGGFVDDMLEAGGKLTDAAVNAKINQAAADDPEALLKQKRIVDDLGVSWQDFARAKYGDAAAAKRTMDRLAELNDEISRQAAEAGSASGQMYAQQTAINGLAKEIGTAAKAYDIATEATQATASATSNVKTTLNGTAEEWRDLRADMRGGVTARVNLRMPTRSQYVTARANLTRGLGTLVVPVRPGQSRYANTADNSRYRE